MSYQNVLHGWWHFSIKEILNIFHFNINLLSPDLKYSWSTSKKSGILVMSTVVIASFVSVESFDKCSSSSPFIFPINALFCPSLHTLLLTFRPLLTCLISTQLLCHFLSHLLGFLESSHVGFMYNQIFLHASRIVVVRNHYYSVPLPQISWKSIPKNEFSTDRGKM